MDIPTCRKRRGISRASITRLTTKLKDLEGKADQPGTFDLAQRMKERLQTLDSEFKTHHYTLVDQLEGNEFDTEQETLDEHDDEISILTVRIQQLITLCASSPISDLRKTSSRRLARVKKTLTTIADAITALRGDDDDVFLLRQYEEQIAECKKELSDTHNSLLSIDLDDEDELSKSLANLEKELFGCSLSIKKLLKTPHRDTLSTDSANVKLPKLDIPLFDGNILNWRTFWEQFKVSIHERSNLTDSQKLVYLQHSLKNGSAKTTIEGLSRSGDCYAEAIDCLKSRYDHPRLIHQTHVKMILDATPLKDGTGKELRHLHDTIQQHLRALKSMDYEPSSPFITSIIELKLDANTRFEWQKHSQDSNEVPPYQKLLDFLNLRAQASEASTSSDHSKKPFKGDRKPFTSPRPVASYTSSTMNPVSSCIVCKDKHPLYACPKFKSYSHENMISTLRTNHICMNCLRPGHVVKQCRSLHHCKKCQKPHHTLLHVDGKTHSSVDVPVTLAPVNPVTPPSVNPVSANAALGFTSGSLLMTCCILVKAPDGSPVEARAVLDSASSASFVSERLSQSLCLPRSMQNVKISGIAGISQKSPSQAIAHFSFTALRDPTKQIDVAAIVVPRVTCDLPLHPVAFDTKWKHLAGLQLADPTFGQPGRIDVLLGVDILVQVLLDGRRIGPPGSPAAFETELGWVLAGGGSACYPSIDVANYHAVLNSSDDLLQKFWEIEESPTSKPLLTSEEQAVVQHFEENHSRLSDGRFVVPLPKRPNAKPLGESRSQCVRRFCSLEHSLRRKGQFSEFSKVMEEYLELGHAEMVPADDLNKPPHDVFYLPVHAVRKDSSTTTKLRAVFDASAKSSSGMSLNDMLLVGPTVHPSLIDVLLRFRCHRIALTTDVSKMYRAVVLPETDRDLHRFVWRKTPSEPLQDFRMTRVTFGVSSSSFAANMAVKRNALNLASKYPLAAKVVNDSFYVDDGLTGADSVHEATSLQSQLQNLFSEGGFLLRKWNASDPTVLKHIPPDLLDTQSKLTISDPDVYTKTLGVEWNANLDQFRLTVTDLPSLERVTKRLLVSDIAKTFDVLGWFSPSTIMAKILLQRVWEQKVDWDDSVPQPIHDAWLQWRTELHLLTSKGISRCYFPKSVRITSIQLHGFSDASEAAYAGVVYLRLMDSNGNAHVSLVASKTKVAPIKRLTIPRLELCGAHLLAKLIHHIKDVLHIPHNDVFAWTDSMIVLDWLVGNPRRFKTYVGNRVSCIIELLSPSQWNHVNGTQNPADCASRGLFPSELLKHNLWWNGPEWLRLAPAQWPKQPHGTTTQKSDEEREISLLVTTLPRKNAVLAIDKFSSFTKLKRVTAWLMRFVNNCRAKGRESSRETSFLTVAEITAAEAYWLSISQEAHFSAELEALKSCEAIPDDSSLVPLCPFLDPAGLIRVGGREHHSKAPFASQHPIILHSKHPITHLIVQSEHLRMLHAGPQLLSSSINYRYHIIGQRKIIRSITRGCVTCRKNSVRPRPQMMGQLPMERVTPDSVFERVGLDYAGPIYVKHGSIRKPTVTKAYICVFVSLSVKAVHLELVSDMTSDAFIAALRRFTARRGKPNLLWSDHGSNFVGASRELKELTEFLNQQKIQGDISQFCSSQNIQWKFIPEHAPHFGGIWEAAVKSTKLHLRRILGDVKLTFEEFATVLCQVEACLNSRPLAPLPGDEDGLEALTPGHFLIGRPLESIPDPAFSYRSISLLRRWHLCQNLVRHFWKRWYSEYVTQLRRFTKWHRRSRNACVGDMVILHEDGLVPGKWPLARIVQVHPGKDGIVRVVTIRTATGTYKRPANKVALLLPNEN